MNGATKTIWKTVVFAGAMLGTAACGGKKAEPTTPAATDTAGDSGSNGDTPDTAATDTADPCAADPCAADPCAAPGAGRPRGVSDEGDTGRGFILS
jgi:hypothetical protein